jgi:nitrogen fixation protein NifU and related proteins
MSRFSDIVMDHFNSPRNRRRMEAPDRVGVGGTPGCGPYLILMLRIQDDRVREATCETHGCGVTIASGSMLTEMVVNRSLHGCRQISTEELTEALGGVPSDKAHGPALAVAALRNALQEVNVG